jgi:hypothetical protein
MTAATTGVHQGQGRRGCVGVVLQWLGDDEMTVGGQLQGILGGGKGWVVAQQGVLLDQGQVLRAHPSLVRITSSSFYVFSYSSDPLLKDSNINMTYKTSPHRFLRNSWISVILLGMRVRGHNNILTTLSRLVQDGMINAMELCSNSGGGLSTQEESTLMVASALEVSGW